MITENEQIKIERKYDLILNASQANLKADEKLLLEKAFEFASQDLW